jgi:hypothetical protein
MQELHLNGCINRAPARVEEFDWYLPQLNYASAIAGCNEPAVSGDTGAVKLVEMLLCR